MLVYLYYKNIRWWNWHKA